MPKLNEVFGISTSIPRYTYVDRLGLDKRLEYLLDTDRHIVIHGGSKQGKTILRKKVLPETNCIVVPCRPNFAVEDIYQEILRQCGASIGLTQKTATTTGGKFSGSVKGDVGIPVLASGKIEGAGEGKLERMSETVTRPAGNEKSILFVVEHVRACSKRIILEDFHYLPEEERRRLAFDLKAFWDASVFFIIVGVWAEQNLLTLYNNDLSARVEEIDVRWDNGDLQEVLSKGETALNVRFNSNLRSNIIADSNQNVGLLQRLAEAVCLQVGVYEAVLAVRSIDAPAILDACRRHVCQSQENRYHGFVELVGKGFKDPERTKLKMYKHLVRVCFEATDQELLSGLERQQILSRIQRLESEANLNVLSAALTRLDRLQAERRISPPILSFNNISKTVSLVDREFLFYRRYTSRSWPWQQPGYEDDDDEALDPLE